MGEKRCADKSIVYVQSARRRNPDAAIIKAYLLFKKEMVKKGIDSRAKYRKNFKNFSPEERLGWSYKPEIRFRGLYASDFYGSRCVRSKKRTLEYLMDACEKKGLKTLAKYLEYRQGLSSAERRCWPRNPWEYYGKTNSYFFRKKKGARNVFYPYQKLQQVLLAAKALYVCDCVLLNKKDPKIPCRPHDQSWFVSDEDLFLYRRDPEIIFRGRFFYYSRSALFSRMRVNLVFNKKDYEKFVCELELSNPEDARLYPKDLYYFFGKWSWRNPELLTFVSAAEVSAALKKLGLKSREEYFSARKKYPALPEKPEDFLDWPAKVEGTSFSEAEAWEIFLGTYNSDVINVGAEDPFFDRLQARRSIRAAEEKELNLLSGEFDEDGFGPSEAAMEALLDCA